jgi:hypothetical protein
MSTSQNTTAETAIEVIDRSSLAVRVREAGGGGFPPHVLAIYAAHDARMAELLDDRKLSTGYRDELISQQVKQTGDALQAAEEHDVAEARKSLEQERGQILHELHTADSAPVPSVETEFERQGRLTAQTLEALRVNNELLALSGSGDPDALLDSLEVALLRETPHRARALGGVVIGRLRTLAADETPGATDAYASAVSRFGAWSSKHPSAISRLRRVNDQLASVEQPLRNMHARMKSYFKFGRAAYGQRI